MDVLTFISKYSGILFIAAILCYAWWAYKHPPAGNEPHEWP
jgi:hypothetical protein